MNNRCLIALTLALALQASTLVGEGPDKVRLWPDKAPVGDGASEVTEAALTVYPLKAEKPTSAVVICPGGGYGTRVSGPEGHGIARWLNAAGIAGAVLDYRLPAGRARVPLLDAQRAIRTLRHEAARWNIDPRRVGIIGFSAGGHLASTAATHFDSGDSHATDPIQRLSSRPDFAILVYPVVTMTQATHGGSRRNLLGAEPTPALIDEYSNEKRVTRQTPPILLVHAKDDTVVVPDNSQRMYEALKAHGVPAEYLELPRGGHGLNGYKGPMWNAWQKRAPEWLKERGF